MLVLGVYGGRVMLVDEATGEERWAVQAHAGEDAFTQPAMSPSGRFMASQGGKHANWMLWDAARGAERMAGARHDGTGACICQVDERGHRVVQAGCPVVAHTAGQHALAFSPCGQRFATGDDDGVVILWDAETGRAEQRMQAGPEMVLSLSFAADGARLACGSGDGSISVWDVTTGVLLRTWEEEDEMPLVQFSPVNNSIVSVVSTVIFDKSDKITLWDVDSGETLETFKGCGFAVFSPDGRTIATASDAKDAPYDLLLVDAQTGTARLTLVGHLGLIGAACFSVDSGSKLASASDDGTCKVWDSSTGALLRTINVGIYVIAVSWGRDWVRDTQRAFAMGHHPRLGEGSEVLALDAGVVRMILDRV
jgi:WD40 repeat protein